MELQIARLFSALSGLGLRLKRHQVGVEANLPSVLSAELPTGPLARCVKLVLMGAPQSARVQPLLISNYPYVAGFVSRLAMCWCQSGAGAAGPCR